MTFVDVTLTPAATYTYVHNGQFYDQLATTLTAHSAWQYVEYVDSLSGGVTYRRHVWRCKSAQSGLPNDFYVVFQTQFTTATGVFITTSPVYVTMAEVYSSGVLSKIASSDTSITPAADLTNPATWTLTTFAAPAGIWHPNNSRYTTIGTYTTLTSARFMYCVAKDGIWFNWGAAYGFSAQSSGTSMNYVGAYDTVLGSTADPMPLVMFANSNGNNGTPVGGCTRAPSQTPGVAVTEVFVINHGVTPSASNISIGNSGPWTLGSYGVLGQPATTTWPKSYGGVIVGRTWFSSFTTSQGTNSTKGITRGMHKYVRGVGSMATHSPGDTFLVDGKVYLGLGSAALGLWDTQAV